MAIQEKWKNIINWGVTDDLPFNVRNKIRTFNISVFVIGVIYIFYTVVSFLLGDYLAALLTLIAYSITAFCLFLMVRRKYLAAFHITATTGIIFLYTFTMLYGENTQTHIYFLFMPVACIVLFDNFKISLVYFIVTVFAIVSAKVMLRNFVPYYPPREVNEYLGYLNIIMACYLIFIAVRMFKNENLRYSNEINKQKDLIEEKNKSITDSIRYAKRIQETLLPSEKYIEKTLNRLMKKEADEK